ncbi:hypothetical protein J7E62_00875 [Variovorax paradoxus]|nr:hypothetical protein [Variovorax paradoxus]
MAQEQIEEKDARLGRTQGLYKSPRGAAIPWESAALDMQRRARATEPKVLARNFLTKVLKENVLRMKFYRSM